MKVILAGHNVDRELLVEWHRFLEQMRDFVNPDEHPEIPRPAVTVIRSKLREWLQADNLTPETLSAAYARISRDPRPVDLLRAESRQWVSKARRSNRSIVFGLGHNSVAEHAVFNLDVIGISRLAMESLQQHRLCSFTEKSQRYIRLGQDFVIPDEIRDLGLSIAFHEYVARQFQRYEQICATLAESIGKDPSETGEDARYVLPLCVTSQMGMTLNARNLEYLLRCTASSPLSEVREFGKATFKVIDGTAPSLIKYTDETSALRDVESTLRAHVPTDSCESKNTPESETGRSSNANAAVRLVWSTEDADTRVLDALFLRSGIHRSAAGLTVDEQRDMFVEIYKILQAWDPVPREFEYAEAVFDVAISAAAFGQLKRHRMATITSAAYHPCEGITQPPLFNNTPAVTLFEEAVRDAEAFHDVIHARNPAAAAYPLLNAHRRRVRIKINARELNHLSRLREDQHAQWDIRTIAHEMIQLASRSMPLSVMCACGKDAFEEKRGSILGCQELGKS